MHPVRESDGPWDLYHNFLFNFYVKEGQTTSFLIMFSNFLLYYKMKMQNNSLAISEEISYNPMGKKHNRFWDELNIRDLGKVVLLIYIITFLHFLFYYKYFHVTFSFLMYVFFLFISPIQSLIHSLLFLLHLSHWNKSEIFYL